MKSAGRLWAVIFLFSLTQPDIFRINSRREFYPPPVARLFQNKITARAFLIRRQIFSYFRPDALIKL